MQLAETALSRVPVIGLAHPDGCVSGCVVYGSNVPVDLVPVSSGGPAGLAVLAPSRRECRTPGWVDEHTGTALSNLAADGVLYVMPPAGWSGRLERMLIRRGLTTLRLVHWPGFAISRYIAPLRPDSMRYVLTSLTANVPGPVRNLTSLACRCLRPLGAVVPTAIAATRPGGRTLFSWLTNSGDVVVRNTQTGGWGSVTLHVLPADGGAAPERIAKLMPAAAAGILENEARALSELGPAARNAGAALPGVVGLLRFPDYAALVRTAVPGRSAAALLVSSPRSFESIVNHLGAWLGRWNSMTASVPASPKRVKEQWLLEPARLLAPFLPGSEEYLRWLCDGEFAPSSVAAHHDLTMWNVICGDGDLGIVDWEAGSCDSLPLTDFFYAVADAAAACRGYRDRGRAFTECFAPSGLHVPLVRAHTTRMAVRLGLSRREVALLFQACWLHHAANEHRRSASRDAARPFLEILRRAASARQDIEGVLLP